MSEEFEFFSTDFYIWNFNNMINKPGLDPFNNNKKLDQFGEREREPAFPRQILKSQYSWLFRVYKLLHKLFRISAETWVTLARAAAAKARGQPEILKIQQQVHLLLLKYITYWLFRILHLPAVTSARRVPYVQFYFYLFTFIIYSFQFLEFSFYRQQQALGSYHELWPPWTPGKCFQVSVSGTLAAVSAPLVMPLSKIKP